MKSFLFLLSVCLWSLVAFAQAPDLITGPIIVQAEPVDLTGQVTTTLVGLVIRFPWLITVITLIGLLRVVFKPAMALLHGYVATTSAKEDDELLQKVERSMAFTMFSWFLDFVGSIKLDTVKRAVPKPAAQEDRSRLVSLLAVLAIPAFVLLPGCSTTGGATALTLQRLERITRVAVWSTTTAWTIKNPGTKPAFESALLGINALVAEERWDLVELASSLTSSGVNTFTGDEARLIISGTVLAIDTFAGQNVDLSQSEYARAVVLGAQAGLRLALTGEK